MWRRRVYLCSSFQGYALSEFVSIYLLVSIQAFLAVGTTMTRGGVNVFFREREEGHF